MVAGDPVLGGSIEIPVRKLRLRFQSGSPIVRGAEWSHPSPWGHQKGSPPRVAHGAVHEQPRLATESGNGGPPKRLESHRYATPLFPSTLKRIATFPLESIDSERSLSWKESRAARACWFKTHLQPKCVKPRGAFSPGTPQRSAAAWHRFGARQP
jgi:hypothetical protein